MHHICYECDTEDFTDLRGLWTPSLEQHGFCSSRVAAMPSLSL